MECELLFDLFVGVVSTVVGGLLLAFLFFLARETVYCLPSVNGTWNIEMRTTKTAYQPYEGMVLRYVANLWREGAVVRGSVEKVWEKSTTGTRKYVGENRTRGFVEGYIEKRYLPFAQDRVSLHIVEQGHGRESTHFHHLKVDSRERLTGVFSTMVADSEGDVVWQRQQFSA